MIGLSISPAFQVPVVLTQADGLARFVAGDVQVPVAQGCAPGHGPIFPFSSYIRTGDAKPCSMLAAATVLLVAGHGSHAKQHSRPGRAEDPRVQRKLGCPSHSL